MQCGKVQVPEMCTFHTLGAGGVPLQQPHQKVQDICTCFANNYTNRSKTGQNQV